MTKYIEDQKQKEGGDISGTFGDGINSFNFSASNIHKVDPYCTFENVGVLQDYSCILTL